jgi:hypothetical protein
MMSNMEFKDTDTVHSPMEWLSTMMKEELDMEQDMQDQVKVMELKAPNITFID